MAGMLDSIIDLTSSAPSHSVGDILPVNRFWINNQSRMYLLEGAAELHHNYGMAVGDVMVFAQKQSDQSLLLAGRPPMQASCCPELLTCAWHGNFQPVCGDSACMQPRAHPARRGACRDPPPGLPGRGMYTHARACTSRIEGSCSQHGSRACSWLVYMR